MNYELEHKKALEKETELLARIDAEQAALVRDGFRPSIALKNVLRAYELSPRRYWNMCHVSKEYQEDA